MKTALGSMTRTLVLVAGLLATSAQASAQKAVTVAFDGPLPAVAAEYRVQVRDNHGKQTVDWRFWREAHRLVRENTAARTSEVWELDGQTLLHQKLWHDARRGVEYQPTDLQLAGVPVNWQRRALLVDPALLASLKLVGEGSRGGVPFRRYRGDLEGSKWDITLRTDLMLPTRIEHVQGKQRELLALQKAWAQDMAPWKPVDASAYELIDFADLGDREDDPFVRQIEEQVMPAAHARTHAHAH